MIGRIGTETSKHPVGNRFRVEFTYLSTHLASHGYLVVFVGKPEMLGRHAQTIRENRCAAVIAPRLDPRIKATPRAAR